MPDWDEGKHPRANDGKFGAGAGSGGPREAAKAKATELVAKARGQAKKPTESRADEASKQPPDSPEKISEKIADLNHSATIGIADALSDHMPNDAREFIAGLKTLRSGLDGRDDLAAQRKHLDGLIRRHEKSLDEYSGDIETAKVIAAANKRSYSAPISATEDGAMTTSAWKAASAEFATTLSEDQRKAFSAYSGHTDSVLNRLLRRSDGKIPESMLLYDNDTERAEIHGKNLAKRNGKSDVETTDMQGASIKGQPGSDITVHQEMANLDSAIASSKLPRDTKLYRAFFDPGGKVLGNLVVGSVMQDHGYTSTTSNRDVMHNFTNPNAQGVRVNMIITAKKGTSGAPMGKISKYEKEREVLLPRGSKFRVTNITDEVVGVSPREIHLEVVDE